MKSVVNQGTIRAQLAEHTREAHLALHQHPWITGLLSENLTVSHYQAVIEAYKVYVEQVEAARIRMNVCPPLSLQSAAQNLVRDSCEIDNATSIMNDRGSSHKDVNHQQKHFSDELHLHSREQILAALYVLHGSRFGSAMIGKKLKMALPQFNHHYFCQPTPKHQWLELITSLDNSVERDPTGLENLLQSAEFTFRHFGSHVTHYCTQRVSTKAVES